MKTILNQSGGHPRSTRKIFFTAFASALLALCIGCETAATRRAIREAEEAHARQVAEIEADGERWAEVRRLLASNQVAQAEALMTKEELESRRIGEAFVAAARGKADPNVERYNRREHVPELLRKYAAAPAAWRAALADAWVVPGMPREMVADTLLGCALESESTTAAGRAEIWRWRAWRLVIENGLLTEIGRRH